MRLLSLAKLYPKVLIYAVMTMVYNVFYWPPDFPASLPFIFDLAPLADNVTMQYMTFITLNNVALC